MKFDSLGGLSVLLFVLVGLGTLRLLMLNNQGKPWADGFLLLTG